MVTERQVVSIFAVLGTIAALSFSVYQLYLAFKPPVEATKT